MRFGFLKTREPWVKFRVGFGPDPALLFQDLVIPIIKDLLYYILVLASLVNQPSNYLLIQVPIYFGLIGS